MVIDDYKQRQNEYQLLDQTTVMVGIDNSSSLQADSQPKLVCHDSSTIKHCREYYYRAAQPQTVFPDKILRRNTPNFVSVIVSMMSAKLSLAFNAGDITYIFVTLLIDKTSQSTALPDVAVPFIKILKPTESLPSFHHLLKNTSLPAVIPWHCVS